MQGGILCRQAVEEILQLVAVLIEVKAILWAGHTTRNGSFCHGRRDLHKQAVIEGLRNDVLGPKVWRDLKFDIVKGADIRLPPKVAGTAACGRRTPAPPTLAEGREVHVGIRLFQLRLPRQFCDGMGSSKLHLLVDGNSTAVQGPAEYVGESADCRSTRGRGGQLRYLAASKRRRLEERSELRPLTHGRTTLDAIGLECWGGTSETQMEDKSRDLRGYYLLR